MVYPINNSYTKAIGISLILHGMIFGLFMSLGQAASGPPFPETKPALIEVIHSSLLSTDGLGGTGDMSPQSGGISSRSDSPQTNVQDHIQTELQTDYVNKDQIISGEPDTTFYQPGTIDQSLPSILQGNSDSPELAQAALPGIGDINSPTGSFTDKVNSYENDSIGFSGDGYGNGGTSASVIRGLRPHYPAVARKAGWEGTVLVRILIDTQGLAVMVSIRKSSGYQLLDDAVLSTVKKWRFSPATQGGKAIASFHDIRVRFRLTDPE